MQARAQELIHRWEADTITSLCRGYDVMLENAGDVLVDFASKSENLRIQNDFFDAQREIYLKGHETAQAFHKLLQQLPGAARRKQAPEPGADTLSLLNTDEYELSIALDTIASRCRIRNQGPLHALQERLSALAGGKVVAYRHISINPHKVTEAFQEGISRLEVDNRVRLVVYTLFDRYVISRFDEAFEEINQELADAGVLPTIRYTAVVHERETGKPRKQSGGNGKARPGNDSDTQRQTDSYNRDNSVPTTEESMLAISQLLNSRRQKLPTEPDLGLSAPPAGGSTRRPSQTPPLQAAPDARSVQSINQVLESAQPQLQTNTAAAIALSDDKMIVDKRLLLRVREALRVQRQMIKSLTDKANLAPREQQLIDVVGMLFEAILDDESIPLPVKTLLSHLHTPYLKVAVNDGAFLQGNDHPARNLLDQMLRVGVRWVNPDRLHQGAFPTLQYCVRKILDNPLEIDFDHLRKELDNREKQLRHSNDVTEKRTLDTERGQATLARAREMAQSAVHEIIVEHPLPTQVSTFLKTVFVDYLALLLLRNKLDAQHPKSREALKETIGMIEQITTHDAASATLSATRLGALITELLPHYQPEIDQFVNQLSKPLDNSAPLPQQEPEPVVKTQMAPDADEQSALNLKAGNWFAWKPDDADEARQIKLIWTNPHTRNLLFVDQNGIKVAHLKAKIVAGQLKSGELKAIKAPERGKLFDGLMHNVRKRIESNSQAKA